MSVTKNQITRYFKETLGADVAPEVWQPGRRLPLFLRDGYTFYEVEFLGNRYLLMADKEPTRSAATIRKHIEQVQPKWNGDTIIYVREQTTSDERRRWIEQKIPFVVPGNQMYLPMLGIDLREHFRRLREEVTRFTPTTQAVILLLLTDPGQRAYDAQQLAERLGCSKMTASRCLNELMAADLKLVRVEGRKRVLEFDGNRRALWERAMPLFDNPVKHRQHIHVLDKDAAAWLVGESLAVKAGLTALAQYSMLAPSPIPTLAATSGQWKKIEAKPNVKPTTPTNPDAVAIEVWSYEPLTFTAPDTCDPFSLFLSLKDDPDERVQTALEEMMEAIEW